MSETPSPSDHIDPGLPNLRTYDYILAAIPLLFVTTALASTVTALPFQTGTALAAGFSLLPIGLGLFHYIPVE